MIGHFLELLGGAALVMLVVVDALGTLVVTQGTTARWRPTRIFYASSWWAWRWIGTRVSSPARRERFLSIYAPLSLLVLLMIWLVGLLVGWSFVYLAFANHINGPHDYSSLLFLSQTSLLTVGGSDVGLQSTPLRLLTLMETITGLGTVALLIGYLPALYASYSRREGRLLTLDDPSGRRVTPARVIVMRAPAGDVEPLYRYFAEWEMWTAEVLESHVSYPMLALFRSQHAGQSWITALGVVLDAATLACAAIPGAEIREPYFMHRRGRRALAEISSRLHVPAKQMTVPGIDAPGVRFAYDRLTEAGLSMRPFEDTLVRVMGLRREYEPQLEALIDALAAPRGFWGHSSETLEDIVRPQD